MEYVEEKTFEIRVRFRMSFPEGYEGEDDGYVWWEHFDATTRTKLTRAVLEALASEPGCRVTPVSRGQAQDEAYEILVERA